MMTIPWDLMRLKCVPKVFPAPASIPADGIQTLCFEGEPYLGKSTRVFAYYGMPDGASAEKKVPGMVLVHGSGDTAFSRWVKLWNSRGYAALALDHCGQFPVGQHKDWRRNPEGGPARNDIDDLEKPVGDQWMYHAVSAIIRAHSLLGSFPEVDAQRIGITGISLGAMLVSAVVGVDNRFRFAAPVYGCAYVAEEWEDGSCFVGGGATLEQRRRWRTLWEPSRFLSCATLPLLWINGTNDFAFTLRAWRQSHACTPAPRTLSLRVRMEHGQDPGAVPEEIAVFADSVVRGGEPLLRIVEENLSGPSVEVRFDAPCPVVAATLNFTCSGGVWQERVWESLPATVSGNYALALVPDNATAWYLGLTDQRGLLVTSDVRIR